MIYKLIGTLILLLAGGYVSLAVGRFERRRLRVLDGYISLLYYIKGQIDCYAMPLPEILLHADPAMLAACLGLDFGRPLPPLPEGLGAEPPLPAMVRESRLYLEPESERLLTTFTGELGSALRGEQVARCEYYIQALTEERKKLSDTLPARLRVSCVLCMCCATLAAILLW